MDVIRRIGHAYTAYTPRMKRLDQMPRNTLFRICVWVVLQAYSHVPAEEFPTRDLWPTNSLEWLQLKKSVPGSHVVYAFGEDAFIGFRGIDPSNQKDLKRCMHLINHDIPEDPELLGFCEEVQRKYPRTYLTGHSYGGMKANWLSRTMVSHPPAILFNPAQGFDPTYPTRFEAHPQITTYHILGDFVSRVAGLENPDGIHLIKVSEDTDKHGIRSFAKGLEHRFTDGGW